MEAQILERLPRKYLVRIDGISVQLSQQQCLVFVYRRFVFQYVRSMQLTTTIQLAKLKLLLCPLMSTHVIQASHYCHQYNEFSGTTVNWITLESLWLDSWHLQISYWQLKRFHICFFVFSVLNSMQISLNIKQQALFNPIVILFIATNLYSFVSFCLSGHHY